MNTKGKTSGGSILVGLALLMVILASGIYIWDRASGMQSGTLSQGGAGTGNLLPPGDSCGEDKSSTMTLNLNNKFNDTARENFDADYVIYTADGQLFATGTDSTEASVSSLNCGQQYVIRFVSSDGAGADNAMISAVRSGQAEVIEGGKAVLFKASARNFRLELNGKQAAYVQVRVWDRIQSAWFTDNTGDGSTSEYETDGATFRSTASNTTAIVVSTGGRIDSEFSVQSTLSDADFADFGFLVAVNAAPTTWDRPSVQWEGVTLTETKGTLDSKAQTALSDYEYVYFVAAPQGALTMDQRTDKSLRFRIAALSGVDPGASDDVEVDFFAVGASRETAGNGIRVSSHTDAASPAAVRTVQDFAFDVQ